MPNHKYQNRSWLAFAAEASIGEAPANWGTGVHFEHLGCDVSGVKANLVVDGTMETSSKAQNKRARLKGPRGVDWSFRAKCHGLGATAAEDAQAATEYLGTLLGWALGGTSRSYRRAVVSAADAHTITVGAGKATGFAVGQVVWVQDLTSPSAANAGKPHARQIVSVDGGTDTIELHADLPFVPASGDVIYAATTNFLDEDVLEDAAANDATMAFFHKRTSGDTDTLYQMVGSVANLSIANLGKGQAPEFAFSVMSANFKHSGEDSLTEPTLAAIVGKPQLVNGPDLTCLLMEYGSTTPIKVHVRDVAMEIGASRTREETTTEVYEGVEGLSTYSAQYGDTKATMTLATYDPAFYGGMSTDKEYSLLLYNPGPGTNAAKGWAIMLPRVVLTATPGMVNGTATLGTQLEFCALIPDTGDTEIATSPILISRC